MRVFELAATPPLVGYQKKPPAITALAGMFLAMPALLLLQIFWVAGGDPADVGNILGSTYFMQEWLLCWSAALAIYAVTTWSLAYFVLLSAFTLVRRMKAMALYPEFETPLGLLITAAWLGASAYLLLSTLKLPYLNPKLRWWTRPARVPISRQAVIRVGQVSLPATVLNLSTGGVFLKVGDEVAAGLLPERLGQTVGLAIELGPQDGPYAWRLDAEARVVWRGKPDSPYQRGMGLMFVGLPAGIRRQLKRFLRDAARSADVAGA
jgi:hypothetical protein